MHYHFHVSPSSEFFYSMNSTKHCGSSVQQTVVLTSFAQGQSLGIARDKQLRCCRLPILKFMDKVPGGTFNQILALNQGEHSRTYSFPNFLLFSLIFFNALMSTAIGLSNVCAPWSQCSAYSRRCSPRAIGLKRSSNTFRSGAVSRRKE